MSVEPQPSERKDVGSLVNDMERDLQRLPGLAKHGKVHEGGVAWRTATAATADTKARIVKNCIVESVVCVEKSVTVVMVKGAELTTLDY